MDLLPPPPTGHFGFFSYSKGKKTYPRSIITLSGFYFPSIASNFYAQKLALWQKLNTTIFWTL